MCSSGKSHDGDEKVELLWGVDCPGSVLYLTTSKLHVFNVLKQFLVLKIAAWIRIDSITVLISNRLESKIVSTDTNIKSKDYKVKSNLVSMMYATYQDMFSFNGHS